MAAQAAVAERAQTSLAGDYILQEGTGVPVSSAGCGAGTNAAAHRQGFGASTDSCTHGSAGSCC
jgi:hypothetical protein